MNYNDMIWHVYHVYLHIIKKKIQHNQQRHAKSQVRNDPNGKKYSIVSYIFVYIRMSVLYTYIRTTIVYGSGASTLPARSLASSLVPAWRDPSGITKDLWWCKQQERGKKTTKMRTYSIYRKARILAAKLKMKPQNISISPTKLGFTRQRWGMNQQLVPCKNREWTWLNLNRQTCCTGWRPAKMGTEIKWKQHIQHYSTF